MHMNIRNIIIGLASVSALGGIIVTTSLSEATVCGPQTTYTSPLFCGGNGTSINFEAKSLGKVGPDRIEATLGNASTATIKRAIATGRTGGGIFCCQAIDKVRNGTTSGVTVNCPPIAGQCNFPSQHDAISSTTP
jgi:hypothetical protein